MDCMTITQTSPALSGYRHWVFDMDGTLTEAVHDFALIRRALEIPAEATSCITWHRYLPTRLQPNTHGYSSTSVSSHGPHAPRPVQWNWCVHCRRPDANSACSPATHANWRR